MSHSMKGKPFQFERGKTVQGDFQLTSLIYLE